MRRVLNRRLYKLSLILICTTSHSLAVFVPLRFAVFVHRLTCRHSSVHFACICDASPPSVSVFSSRLLLFIVALVFFFLLLLVAAARICCFSFRFIIIFCLLKITQTTNIPAGIFNRLRLRLKLSLLATVSVGANCD